MPVVFMCIRSLIIPLCVMLPPKSACWVGEKEGMRAAGRGVSPHKGGGPVVDICAALDGDEVRDEPGVNVAASLFMPLEGRAGAHPAGSC